MNTNKNTLLYGLFSFLFSFGVFAQSISGFVESDDGPLPGATIIVKGTSNGTNTDFDGNFSIDASQGDLAVEALVLTVIVVMVALLYVGKKVVDKRFK